MRCSSVLLASVAVVAGCSPTPASGGPARGTEAPSAADPWLAPASPALPAGAVTDARRWIPGDLHVHLAPFDVREGASMRVADVARRGAAAGLEFVVTTPHLRPHTLRDPGRRRAWMARWAAMAAEARARPEGALVIPGAEWTIWGHGHYGVSGLDLTRLPVDDVLVAAERGGGFVVVNHPFALPTEIPGIPLSERDLSYRPWSHERGADEGRFLDGVEVYNQPLALANLVSRPGGLTGEERAFAAADRLARTERRPVAVVGGSDTHTTRMAVTTWVLAAEVSERAILAALATGATCVGGLEAGTLMARGDGDAAGRWARIGEAVTASREVELRWSGRARLFVDGVDRGVHDGGFVHRDAAGPHTYRLEVGGSRCGFVYANLAG